ncbi:MAG: hypothetical protein ACKOZX_04260, partial [Gammaproteobacteria bacterium]
MGSDRLRARLLTACLLTGVLPVDWPTELVGATASATEATGTTGLEEIVVQGDATLAQRLGSLGSRSVLDRSELQAIGATHVSEALVRVPGVWIARGSGQEHLTAIRSPVYAGLGACG